MSTLDQSNVFCESCGHPIQRGKLVCSYCGAVSNTLTRITKEWEFVEYEKFVDRLDHWSYQYEIIQKLFMKHKNYDKVVIVNVSVELQCGNYNDYLGEYTNHYNKLYRMQYDGFIRFIAHDVSSNTIVVFEMSDQFIEKSKTIYDLVAERKKAAMELLAETKLSASKDIAEEEDIKQFRSESIPTHEDILPIGKFRLAIATFLFVWIVYLAMQLILLLLSRYMW